MKNFRFFFVAVLSFSAANLFSQSISPTVVASAGTFASVGGNSIAYTVGEPVITTLTGGTNMITQGFHQPDHADVYAPVLPGGDLQIEVFPNPVTDILHISIGGAGKMPSAISIVDVLGRTLIRISVNEKISFMEQLIDMKKFAAGMYFVRLSDSENETMFSFKVNKIH